MGIYSWKRENDLNLKINTLLFLVCFILVIIGSFEKKSGFPQGRSLSYRAVIYWFRVNCNLEFLRNWELFSCLLKRRRTKINQIGTFEYVGSNPITPAE